MNGERVVVLDGTTESDNRQARVSEALLNEIHRAGATTEAFVLRDERIMHCIGCFGCWTETPGLCRSADRGRDIVGTMIHADTVVLVTPVTFGGYSSQLKRVVDRWIQVTLPFFEKRAGELHHPLRYGRFPRIVAIGIQASPDAAEAELFRALVSRNALNFHAPSHAVEVVSEGETGDELRARLVAVLTRHDAMWARESMRAIVPGPSAWPCADTSADGRNVLVLVGSPKTKKPSTSNALGRHLLARLAARGWQGDVLTLTAAIRDDAWKEKMLAAVDAADLVVLAFPLYIDALPTLLTRALEIIREHRRAGGPPRAQRLAALVNSGFPESFQNLLALAICARFASVAKMSWAGGLAMGAGEALSSGAPLDGPAPGQVRPPVGHVIAALDLAAADLAEGRPVPAHAAALMTRTPFPIVPFAAWRRFFAFMGGRNWRREAARNGVDRAALLARPFEAGISGGATAAL